MVQCVSKPAVNGAQASATSPWSLLVPDEVTPATFNTTRPLSPILSPTATPTTAVPVIPAPEPSPVEIPPKVPPKSPPRDGTLSPSKVSSKGASITKRSQSKSAHHPREQPASVLSSSPPGSASNSPRTRSADRKSPSGQAQSKQTNEGGADASVIHRGRPIKKSKKSKDLSSEQEPDGWRLPTGIKTVEAALVLPESERDILRKQACGQVERFEILRSKHVNSLSKVRITPNALGDC
jgi:hypothetical protein